MANNETWMNRKWRPAMAWMYMAICIADFLVFPILWAVFKAHVGETIEPWDPLTLKGAGLFHMAMGAVLGIAAWSRGREKMEIYRNGYAYDEEYHVERETQSQTPINRRNSRKSPEQPEDELI